MFQETKMSFNAVSDFVNDALSYGRRFRILSVVDQCSRERLALVVDTSLSVNANGLIDNGSELFGTPILNGFEALKALDSNADGNITAADAAFSSLKIWKDANHNGITDAGELTTLDANNIASINVVNYTAINTLGNAATGLSHVGSGTKSDGSTIEVGNYNVLVDQRNGAYTKDYDLDLRTLFLPTLKGHGNVADMHIALSLDNGSGAATLMSQMLHLVSYDKIAMFENWDTVKAEFKKILFNWANVDAANDNAHRIIVKVV